MEQELKDALIAAWVNIQTGCTDLAAAFAAFEEARVNADVPNMSVDRTAELIQGAMLNAGLERVLKGSPTAGTIGKRQQADGLAVWLEAL